MAQTGENGSSNLDDLKKKIVRQVEFYFGDYNLMRDTFMRDKMREDDGWFTMDVMLKFKRLAAICSEPQTILEALQTSNIGLLEIDMENKRIRRKLNRRVPEDSEEYRSKLKARTVHVNGFQSEENIDDIHDFIAEYGRLEGIQLLRTPERKFKGSLYVTFFKQEDAEKFVQAPMVYYKCNEITKMLKKDFQKHMDEMKSKKRKSSEEKQKEESDELKGTVCLKVSGITDDTIIHMDVKQVFESIEVNTIRFFDRFESMGSEGYLVFQDGRTPEELLKVLEDKGKGTKVTIKSAEVEFSKPTEEEKKRINEAYLQARQKLFGGRGGKRNQRQSRHGKQQKKSRSPKRGQGKKTTFDSDGENDKAQEIAEDKEEPVAKIAKTE